jgi:type I restriction enzyme S subunit
MTFDKSNWKAVTFGEVCRNVNDNERDPLGAGIERYVGLEHIEPENLHIRSWGNVADGTTFTKVFRPGHVLFGKRRAYQKKAALADFTGLCSGDILVLEPNPAVIDPHFFPFLVQSDRFFDFAVQTSAGSLSPRTKFQDLAQFQFLLPPKDQQARLAELLWAGDAVVEGYGRLSEQINQLRISFQHEKYNFPETISIGQISTKVGSGKTPLGGDKNYLKEGVVFLRSQNVLKGKISLEDIAYISGETHESMRSSKVQEGDVLLNITGASIGRSAVFEGTGVKEANVNQHVCIIRPIHYSPILLCDYLNSTLGQDQINTLQTGGNRQGLNFQNLRQLQVPNFSELVMLEIENQILKIDQQDDAIGLLIESQKKLQSQLLHQIFTP